MAHLDQSPLTDRHETIITLHSGGIHANDMIHPGPEPTSALINRVCSSAAPQHRPTRLSIGHADGRVEHHQLTVDGAIHPHRPPPAAISQPTDPVWNIGIPEQAGLLEPARAAEQAGKWPAAQQAALRTTQHLAAHHGTDHPYTAMGLELQAYFALRAQDHNAAATLYTRAVVARHQLNAPQGETQKVLTHAVAAWLHSERDTRPDGTGFALAHALIRITPHKQSAIAAVLRQLNRDRL
ncbi:hypothetical protein [Streptomyces chryseus]